MIDLIKTIKLVHVSLFDYAIIYLVIHMLITQYTVHTHSHRETVVSGHSEPKMGCEISQSSCGLTSATTREIFPLKSNPFQLDRGALLAISSSIVGNDSEACRVFSTQNPN